MHVHVDAPKFIPA